MRGREKRRGEERRAQGKVEKERSVIRENGHAFNMRWEPLTLGYEASSRSGS